MNHLSTENFNEKRCQMTPSHDSNNFRTVKKCVNEMRTIKKNRIMDDLELPTYLFLTNVPCSPISISRLSEPNSEEDYQGVTIAGN